LILELLAEHGVVIGRPSRLALLDSFLSFVVADGDAWVATCDEIAACVE
jgi:hypothetical protein